MHSAPEKIIDKKPLPIIFDAFLAQPYQIVLGQKWMNRTARLRDILPFSQGHALKCVVQLKVIKGKKKSFWVKDQFFFYAKN